MTIRTIFIISALFTISSLAVPSLHAAGTKAQTAYGAKPESDRNTDRLGYWWYNEPIEEEKDKEKEKEPVPEKPAPPAQREEEPEMDFSLSNYTYQQLWDMHPKQFRKLLEGVHEKSVQYPTVENAREYLTIQNIARKKSLAVANVYAYAQQQDPSLSLEAEMPHSNPGAAARQVEVLKDLEGKLHSVKEDFALLYFVSDNCPICEKQTPFVNVFSRKYGWTVKTINITKSPSLATDFNIQQTPTVAMIKRDSDNFFPIGYGIIASDRFEAKAYSAVRLLLGEITPEQFSTMQYQSGSGFDPLSDKTKRR